MDLAGIQRVIQYEAKHGRKAESLSHANPGYDVESLGPYAKRFIEVKSLAGDWDEMGVGMTPRQFFDAKGGGGSYWLYIVERAEREDYNVIPIHDPANKVEQFLFDNGWRDAAESDK